jgi:hypothetical protein
MLELSFIIVTLLSLWLFYEGTGREIKILYISLGLLLVTGIISYSGFLQNTKAIPPRFLLLMLPVILTFICIYKIINPSKIKRNHLLALHTLRLPVELVLYSLFLERKVPQLMTFSGLNFDIVMGITAILILLFVLLFKKELNRNLMIAWNFIGILFLSFIVTIAILSSPVPFQKLAFDQPNIGILEFPFTYLPVFVVPTVLLSHLLLLKIFKK